MKNLKTLLCVSLEAEQEPCPKAALLLLGYSSLDSVSILPSWISNCSNLCFEAQGRSWRLESVPYKKLGYAQQLLYPGAPQGPGELQG